MKRAYTIVSLLAALWLIGGCGLKARDPVDGPDPTVVETPDDGTDETLSDIDEGVEQPDPLPMDTEFLEWDIEVVGEVAVQRINDRLTRTLQFRLTNTLDSLLTGQIVIEPPQGVSLMPGRTIGWRLRGGRSAEIPVHMSIMEGAPLGMVSLPVTITVLGQEYRRARLDLVKWLDMRVMGPFPADIDAGADVAYPPEKKIDLDRGATWDGQSYEWITLPLGALHPDGMVDFDEIYGVDAPGSAYAVLTIHAAAAAGVVVAFACDSPSTVWLNGGQVFDAAKPLAEESAVEVTLRKGVNRMLVKCSKGADGWAFILNVVGKQGPLPSGVAFDVDLRAVLDREPDETPGTVEPDE